MNCVICEQHERIVPSTVSCVSCDRLMLCDSCGRIHIAEKEFQNHQLIQLDRMSPGEENSNCEQCLADEDFVQAVSFCLDCTDLGPLCLNCSKSHLKQKAFRNHNICNDLQKLFRRNDASSIERQVDDQPSDLSPKGSQIISTPVCKDTTSNSVELTWYAYGIEAEYFLVRYKKENDNRWKMFETEDNSFCVKIEDLSHSTFYIFQVTGMKNGKDVLKSEETEKIKTKSLPLDAPEVIKCTHNMVSLKMKTKVAEDQNQNELELRYRQENMKLWKTFTVTLENQIFQCKNLKENTSYEFQVRKMNREFEENYSSSVTAKTRLAPMENPSIYDIKHDQITLSWKLEKQEIDYFQIRYKAESAERNWQYKNVDKKENSLKIKSLIPDTSYVFQIRYLKDGHGDEFREDCSRARTKKSLALKLKEFSELQQSSNPSVYSLFTTEIPEARNEKAKSKKVVLGNPNSEICMEKTILLVGATGSGKSTLVDGFINYIVGVRYTDPFRFTLVHLEKEEKKANQSISQTEWITEYIIPQNPKGRLPYTLNIIDTPGFGDTRGIQRDEALVEQIRQFFSAAGPKGVSSLDAVCFLIKAPDVRLTSSQTYIFHSILSLFGKDVEDIICTLITFADGTTPPALESINAANLPVNKWLPFNNSALFSDNASKYSSLFWDMGYNSFEDFFETIDKYKPISLTMTKAVLEKRNQIQNIVYFLQNKIKAGLSKLDQLKKQLKLFKEHESDIQKNKDFTYTENETKQVPVSLPKGRYVTTCLHCHVTCHENCAYKDDADKKHCCAMNSSGYCTVCDDRCRWDVHKNTPFIYKMQTVQVTKTYQETKRKYEEAKGKKMSDKKFLLDLTKELKEFDAEVLNSLAIMKGYKNSLRQIALRPDPLALVDHINQMIKAEENEHEDGWEDRIKILEGYRERAELDKTCEGLSRAVKEAIEEVEKENIIVALSSFGFNFMKKVLSLN